MISTGLAAALNQRVQTVQTFKKGPDYIDPMWLKAASTRPCYNLDFNTMGHDELQALFTSRSQNAAIAMIEANKGLFDGVDTRGSDSNAALATLLKTPVVLVVDTAGMTRGIAPLLMGYQAFDRDIDLAGVILNRVGGPRHEAKLRKAVETYTNIPVIGAVANNPDLDIGERHLGLTTPAETGELHAKISGFAQIIGGAVDVDRLQNLARQAPDLAPVTERKPSPKGEMLRIGIAMDTAFGFYYPDDLEAFADAGAELVPINMMADRKLPSIDGLFIGGGFPETQMRALEANASMRHSVKQAIENGLPTYGECGGLMYLGRSLSWQGKQAEMVGVIPGDAVMYPRPVGRGYTRFTQTHSHPWGNSDAEIKAHEFHYAKIENLPDKLNFAREIQRGAGVDGTHDGIILHNLVAGFCHLRNTKSNPWVARFVDFVRALKAS